MKEKWNSFSKTEKYLIIIILTLSLAVLLNWSRVYNGVKKGFDHYKTEETQVESGSSQINKNN